MAAKLAAHAEVAFSIMAFEVSKSCLDQRLTNFAFREAALRDGEVMALPTGAIVLEECDLVVSQA